jgi:hypothetical protein
MNDEELPSLGGGERLARSARVAVARSLRPPGRTAPLTSTPAFVTFPLRPRPQARQGASLRLATRPWLISRASTAEVDPRAKPRAPAAVDPGERRPHV